jgi:hypothetical protein
MTASTSSGARAGWVLVAAGPHRVVRRLDHGSRTARVGEPLAEVDRIRCARRAQTSPRRSCCRRRRRRSAAWTVLDAPGHASEPNVVPRALPGVPHNGPVTQTRSRRWSGCPRRLLVGHHPRPRGAGGPRVRRLAALGDDLGLQAGAARDHQLVAEGLGRGRRRAATNYVPKGKASALIRIPAFGKKYVVPVLEGTSSSVLTKGFGHFTRSADPGEVGNYALAAHRVTHGEPLRRMPELRAGRHDRGRDRGPHLHLRARHRPASPGDSVHRRLGARPAAQETPRPVDYNRPSGPARS